MSAEDTGMDRQGGLSRRQIIKASAVAGAAAWTAPVILDSLSSPAAAISAGCARYEWTGACGSGITANQPTCIPAGWATTPTQDGSPAMTCSHGPGSNQRVMTFTVPAPAIFIGVTGFNSNGNVCQTGPSANIVINNAASPRTVDFTALGGNGSNWTIARLIINVTGGATCP